ncbi:hypothetical protein Vadar_027718 [Vaccinium darrowii]|uniref:Uncharacterized protein n=1 Tax=Vaccinium darrowii TaxID=229202 RepID=A0ACB7YQC1_9ERIC|nr:hypothetical protein Vadar_027718 [Vaccinium darrowii]
MEREGSRPSSRLRHIILGPAGRVQMALERRAAGEGDEERMNTQEVIHRALAIESEDIDFVDNSTWLTVVRQGHSFLGEKDPTGSIWTGIHRKAYKEDLFPGILDPGTCLILKKTIVFLPEKNPYLNITLNNFQCVIEKSVLD